MTREETTKLLKKHWRSIDKFDKKWARTGDVNYLIQLNLLKKQCSEILEKYYETNQKSRESK